MHLGGGVGESQCIWYMGEVRGWCIGGGGIGVDWCIQSKSNQAQCIPIKHLCTDPHLTDNYVSAKKKKMYQHQLYCDHKSEKGLASSGLCPLTNTMFMFITKVIVTRESGLAWS